MEKEIAALEHKRVEELLTEEENHELIENELIGIL